MLISAYALAFPPFETIALTFFIAFLAMLTKWTWEREVPFRYASYGARAWANGVGGLFGTVRIVCRWRQSNGDDKMDKEA